MVLWDPAWDVEHALAEVGATVQVPVAEADEGLVAGVLGVEGEGAGQVGKQVGGAGAGVAEAVFEHTLKIAEGVGVGAEAGVGLVRGERDAV